jgi:hypothetical protein
MSRTLVFVFVLALCLSFLVTGVKAHDPNYEVVASYGSTPTIDGTIGRIEWGGAAQVLFNKTQVLVKQDGVSLYVAFSMGYAPTDLKYDAVYILLDLDDNGGSTPQPDDIGLVVYNNGTLAEANLGTNTFTEVNGWNAVTQSYPGAWQVEFNITYSKINVVAGQEKSIGAFFWSTSFGSTHYYWPPTLQYGNYAIPSEWGAITSAGYDWTRPRYVGVSVGDWWILEVNFTWLTTPYPNAWCDLISNTDWMKCTILDISGTNVTFEQLYHLTNGTERSVSGLIDVATGQSNASSSYMICPYMVISANLTVGEPIFTEVHPYNQWDINETVSRTYAGTNIETNSLNVSSPDSGTVLYFAKDTGILCEFETTFSDNYHVHALAIESPIIPEFPAFLILPLLMITTLLAVIIYGKKDTKTSGSP